MTNAHTHANHSATGTAAVIQRFNDAFLRHEPALLEGLIAEDCVVEGSQPAPDGARYVGRDACLVQWRGIAANRDGHFQLEEVLVEGERAFIFWRYTQGADAMRGINVMRVRGGLIVEGRGYVKARPAAAA